MRVRSTLFLACTLAATMLAATPTTASAQKVIDLTVDMLDRWLSGHEKEKSETKNVEPQLAEADAKIAKFEQCKKDWETAGAASGSRLGGLAARMAIKAKCGSSDADGMRKDRQKILDGPENAGAQVAKFKLDDYRNLKNRLQAWAGGDESGFSKAGLDLLKSRRAQVAATFGMSADVAQSGGGMRAPGVWTTDYAWVYISGLFTMQYLSGATMFEGNYKPGEWTKWSMKSADSDEMQQTERAFLGTTAEGAEWWRMKTITESDTIVLEALFKPDANNDAMQQLVRMRGRFPGQSEAQELMVPQQWGMWNMNGSMGMKPTKESLEGATVGTETVTTPAGTFRAKHVRFGQGNGSIDWWLDETAVGGWVKFQAFDNEKKPTYTMEMIGKGTGAKSELGVVIK
jgi:hypothetical protein